MGSTWEEWQRQTAGYLETDNNIEAEMEEAGKTWNELQWLAQDRPGLRSFVDTLCSTGSKED